MLFFEILAAVLKIAFTTIVVLGVVLGVALLLGKVVL